MTTDHEHGKGTDMAGEYGRNTDMKDGYREKLGIVNFLLPQHCFVVAHTTGLDLVDGIKHHYGFLYHNILSLSLGSRDKKYCPRSYILIQTRKRFEEVELLHQDSHALRILVYAQAPEPKMLHLLRRARPTRDVQHRHRRLGASVARR